MAYAESFKFSLATKSKGGIRHREDFTRELIAGLIGKPLGEIVQVGAQKIVKEAVLAEFEIFMRQYSASLDGRGRPGVVRNGSHRERAIMTAAGELNVKVPRVRDHREGDMEKAQFHSDHSLLRQWCLT